MKLETLSPDELRGLISEAERLLVAQDEVAAKAAESAKWQRVIELIGMINPLVKELNDLWPDLPERWRFDAGKREYLRISRFLKSRAGL